MSEMTQPLSEPAAAVRGTSLWAMARHRFVRNKAAMASLVVLVVVAVFSFGGTWVYPHKYDQIFSSYVAVPPSLDPYPREDTLQQVMQTAVERGAPQAGFLRRRRHELYGAHQFRQAGRSSHHALSRPSRRV